jgi:hypothetical protein
MKVQEYVTFDEAASTLKVNQLTLKNWLKKLGLAAYQFPGTKRKAYVKTEDMVRVREAREKPWLYAQPKVSKSYRREKEQTVE